MAHREARLFELWSKNKKSSYTNTFWFIGLMLAVALGYLAGTYHYQIEAAIGPAFGYKAHSGTLDLTSLQQTYNALAANYDGKLDTNKLIQNANRGLVEGAGDEYTIYMSPNESTEYSNNLSGKIGGGIGAEVGLKNEKITILRTISGNPAEKAGLMANDTVTAINSQSTAGMTVDKAVGLIRGEAGTTVKLTIQREGETKDYTITRDIVNNPSVESKIDGSVGIMTISRFDEETGNLARAAALKFKNQGVKSVIMDLRGNGGGYVTAAVDVAGLWLDNKVVMTERSGGIIKSTKRTGSDAVLSGLPTAILVNGSSASASEIVSGALQDHGAAKLVGEKTFGKGSMQELIKLDGNAELKVTIGRWYTPKGRNIAKEGIKPDVSVGLTQDNVNKGIDPQMERAKQLLNA